jgi:ribosomal protein S6--L-glutamate ligase
MKLVILSRNRNLHSIRRLISEAKKAKVECEIISPLECQLVVDGKESSIFVGSQPLSPCDAVLPRIGASITEYGIAVVKQFESLKIFSVNPSKAIAESRDKMRCLQVLAAAGLKVPTTVMTRSPRGRRMAVEAVKGFPVVLKVLQGTQGVGVMLVHTPVSLSSVLDTLRGLDQDVIIQQFIAEGAGRDYRAFVVGNKVIAAMMRTAPEGEFRSNIHRGGEGRLVKLSPSYEKAALRAAQVLGLEIAGVDIMESNSGPLILEVNSSPGFEGIERATGLNIAGAIIRHIKTAAAKSKKKRKSPARGKKKKSR